MFANSSNANQKTIRSAKSLLTIYLEGMPESKSEMFASRGKLNSFPIVPTNVLRSKSTKILPGARSRSSKTIAWQTLLS